MPKTTYLSDDDVPDFDPFNTPWVMRSWHKNIIQVAAPATSRVYGTVIVGGPCAVWQGWMNHTDPEKAYGCIRIGGEKFLLHRYAFMCHHEIELNPWDIVDHLCRRRLCFNPHHHECTTPLENFLRGDGPLFKFQPLRDKLKAAMDDLPF